MNINLITDAPKHNLALMKISTWHKQQGDHIWLNGVGVFDLTYGSWLFEHSPKKPCDIEGGPYYVSMWMRNKQPPKPCFASLNKEQQEAKPDTELFSLDASIGYTYSACPNTCPFCVVPWLYGHKGIHNSIYDFFNKSSNYIIILNNNTLADPQWKETFEEIWDADLTVIDENGYDLRLLDEEKADALKKTRFKGYIHYAWDRIKDEQSILRGLKMAPKGLVYVLVGFNTTEQEDFYRCQKIHDLGHDPYVMPYNRGNKKLRNFKRFIDSRMYRKYPTLKDAWKDWSGSNWDRK